MMKKNILNKVVLILCFAVCVSGQTKDDTIVIQAKDLELKNIKNGNFSYLVYNKKSKESPIGKTYLVKMKVESKIYNNKPAIAITQKWESEGDVIHTAYTVFDAKDFSTLFHDTFWKPLGYSTKFDFENRKVSFDGNVPEKDKEKSEQGFNESFGKYNLNWHADLTVFMLLPYKDNRKFKINFYDPGFSKAEEVLYSVIGSDVLTGSSGEKIECWILEHRSDKYEGYQRFWISKKTREVLKEEDLYNGQYRYKLKLAVSEEN